MAKVFTNTIDKMDDEELTRLLVSREITEFVDTELTSLRNYALQNLSNCFIYLPNLTSLGTECLGNMNGCHVVVGVTRNNGQMAARGNQTTESYFCFPNMTYSRTDLFKSSCKAIAILPNKTMCELTGSPTYAWEASCTYVPKSLLETYKTDSNWSALADGKILAIEDNTEILTWLEEHGVEYTPDE